MNFTTEQLQTIEAVLRVAYDQYIADFATMQAQDQPRIAAQFEKQAQDCRSLKALIEETV